MTRLLPSRKISFYIFLFPFFGLALIHIQSFAQGKVSFQENRGQWDPEVLYRGQLPNGYIYLRKTGITYSLLSEKDMQTLRESIHGTYKQGKHDHLPYDKGPKHQPNADIPINAAGYKDRFDYGHPLTIHGHAYQVNFLDANKNASLIADHASPGRYNYLIGNDPSRWGRNVKAFGDVTYKDLYPNIDMHLYSDRDGLKYDLILHPGGEIRQIRFQYKGADALQLKRGQLYIKTSVGDNIEIAPYAYQIIEGQKVEIKCQYHVQGTILSFKAGSQYNPDYPLIIDPNFIFSSYSGSTADNWGYTATYDAQGNFYMGGIVFGTGYPATPGAFQEQFAGGGNTYGEGGFDIGLSKLSPDGKTLIFATYLGGSGDEQPHSLVVNSKNQLIISGRTNSGASYPGKLMGKGGGWDMILTELTPDGSGMVGSLRIGGDGSDGVNIADKYTPVQGQTTHSLRRFYGDDARSEVNLDAQGNIILVGSTQSQGNQGFPITSGVFQPGFGGTTKGNAVQQDAVIIKAPPDLSDITWCSYLGGSGNDAAYVLSFSKSGNIYVAGGTESPDFPGMSGTLQTKNNGRADGFIAEISPDGKQLIRATYLGTGQADQIYGIQTDTAGNVYVGGTTEGSWDDYFSHTVHFPKDMKYGKQFICKLNNTLSGIIYSATFGSSGSQKASLPNISPTAFLVDRCQNVYISGWGGNIQQGNPTEYPNQGTSGLPSVNPLHLNQPDGRDFYFFVLKKDAAGVLFADTYGQYGGFTDHVDGGTSRFDPKGVIYQAICANCGGGTIFPTGPPGVFSRQNGSLRPGSNGSAACNEVGFKIAFNLDGVRGGIAPLDRRHKHCNEEEVTFIDTLYGRPAKSWIWDVFKGDTSHHFDGSFTTDTSVFKYQFQEVGHFIVRLIKYNPGDCIERDTSYTEIDIGDNPAMLKVVARKLPPCDSFKYQFINLSTSKKINPIPDSSFVWNFGDGSGDFPQNGDSILHYFPGEGNYTVKLSLKDTAHFCNTPLDTSILISASFELKAGLEVPQTLCTPGSYPLNNTSLGGTNFIWIIKGPHQTDSIQKGDVNSVYYDFQDNGTYDIILIARDTVCNLEDSAKASVTAYPRPTADFNFTSSQPHQNPPVNAVFHFENYSQSHFDQVDSTLNYMWYFGDGNTSSDKNPQHAYAKSGTYTISLIVSNPAGCSDTTQKEVSEDIVPAMDIPTAFTPGSHDINSHIAPRAFGVEKIDFRIYNRWGQMVYHSNDPEITYLPNKGWDGTYKGKPQEMDVYAYEVHVIYGDGSEATKKGSITLVR